jgi:preprotein translocase SecE subunit
VSRIRRFIAESWSELNKVSWPNRVQVRNLTVLVFVVSFVVGLYITMADTGFDYVVRSLASLGS